MARLNLLFCFPVVSTKHGCRTSSKHDTNFPRTFQLPGIFSAPVDPPREQPFPDSDLRSLSAPAPAFFVDYSTSTNGVFSAQCLWYAAHSLGGAATFSIALVIRWSKKLPQFVAANLSACCRGVRRRWSFFRWAIAAGRS